MRALGLGLCTALLAAASAALAAPPPLKAPLPPPKAPPPQLVLKPTPSTAAPLPTRWSMSNAFENDMHDTMDVAASTPLTGGTALAGFRFRFSNGDHKLRRIGVMPKDRYASFAYADSNGDDPFAAEASWAVISTGRSGSVSVAGGGRFEIPIPGKVAGQKLLLSGFEFRRQDGTDANVRSIGVWLDSDRAVARVMLMDDQGPDFRGFENTIGIALLGGAPIGELKLTSDVFSNLVSRMNHGEANGKYRPFAVTVQYAWVPATAIASSDVYTGTSRVPASGKTFPSNGVLQGFEFYFGNSDHYLLDVGVMGPMIRTSPTLVPPSGEVVEYQDNNRDDPMRWAAALANLNPSAH